MEPLILGLPWSRTLLSVHLYSTFNKNFKMIFLGKLFIYVGYGIMKKKFEKLFESAFYLKIRKVFVFGFD